jgi:hypothetical protein
MAQSYRNSETKSRNLKVVQGGAGKIPNLHLGGLAPAQNMPAGQYLVACDSAWTESIGKGVRVVLQFRVIDGPHTGTALRQWVMVSQGGNVISPSGRYAKYCAIALDRPLAVDDNVADPGSIFSGVIFSVDVGFRKTENPKGGKASDENALRCKDGSDFLRVHDILSRGEL